MLVIPEEFFIILFCIEKMNEICFEGKKIVSSRWWWKKKLCYHNVSKDFFFFTVGWIILFGEAQWPLVRCSIARHIIHRYFAHPDVISPCFLTVLFQGDMLQIRNGFFRRWKPRYASMRKRKKTLSLYLRGKRNANKLF